MSSILTWRCGEPQLEVQCSRETLEAIIRSLRPAAGGLRAGGMLLGERSPGRLVVRDFVELPCLRSVSPSLALTDGEQSASQERIAQCDPSEVIGWYIAKSSGLPAPTESDCATLAALFPESARIGLVAQPYGKSEEQFTCICLDSPGASLKLAFDGAEQPVPATGPAPSAPPQTVDPALERILRRSRTPQPVAHSKAPPPSGASRIPKPVAKPVAGEDWESLSAFWRATAAKRPPRRFARAAPWLVAIGCGFLGGVLAVSHGAPQVPVDLLLQASDVNGTLLLRWNHKAVENVDHATVYVEDGHRLVSLPLNHSQLVSGQVRYPRRSPSVTATMVAGGMRDATSFSAAERRRPGNTPASRPR